MGSEPFEIQTKTSGFQIVHITAPPNACHNILFHFYWVSLHSQLGSAQACSVLHWCAAFCESFCAACYISTRHSINCNIMLHLIKHPSLPWETFCFSFVERIATRFWWEQSVLIQSTVSDSRKFWLKNWTEKLPRVILTLQGKHLTHT